MTVVGYARLSRDEPGVDTQVERLRASSCAVVYVDEATGAREPRPQWAAALQALREGDVLVVTTVDRIGRSIADLVAIVAQLDERGVALRSIDDGIDELGPYGRFFFRVMTGLARFDDQIAGEPRRADERRKQEARVVSPHRPAVSRRRLDAARQLRAEGASMRQAAEHVAVPERVLRRELERDDAERAEKARALDA